MRRKKIYEGKAKILYEGPERNTLVQYFKDDATAFNNKKKAVIEGKGVLNNRISEFLLSQLNDIGIGRGDIRRIAYEEVQSYKNKKENVSWWQYLNSKLGGKLHQANHA